MITIRSKTAKNFLSKMSHDMRTKEGKRKQELLSKIRVDRFFQGGWDWEDVVWGRQHWITKEYSEKKNNAIKYIIKNYNLYPTREDGMYNSDDVAEKLGLELHRNCGYEAYSLLEKLEKKQELENKINQKKEIGYKVVRIKNTKTFKPATDSALQKIIYRIDEVTSRFGHEKEYGGFAVFQTLERAKEWQQYYGEKILKVEYIPSTDGLWKKNLPSYNKGYNNYYATSNGINYFEGNYPEGTIIADYVKPLEILN